MEPTTPGGVGRSLTITVADRQHADEVANLHVQYIAEETLLGRSKAVTGLISDYYDELLRREDSSVLVALASGEVVGYASLVTKHTRVLWRLIARQPSFMLKMLAQVQFWYPMARYVFRRVSLEFLGRKWPRGPATKLLHGAHELRAIAVKPSWRGRSVASALLASALKHAAVRQWTPVVAWVEQNNVAANEAFLKVGFELVDKRTDRHGTANLYRWAPDAASAAAPPWAGRDGL
jgi:ribosomal protein S18 acetylase RimI-like enzyme